MSTSNSASPFTINRVYKTRVGEQPTVERITSANTPEQASDLARADRARLRDLRQIDRLDHHQVVTKATGRVQVINIPR